MTDSAIDVSIGSFIKISNPVEVMKIINNKVKNSRDSLFWITVRQ